LIPALPFYNKYSCDLFKRQRLFDIPARWNGILFLTTYRALDQTLGKYYKADELYSQLYKKHFKKQYAGKPTKKYLKLTMQIEQAERIPAWKLERLLLS
jgi:hypothetical protein